MVVNFKITLRNDVYDCNELFLERNSCGLEPFLFCTFFKEENNYVANGKSISVKSDIIAENCWVPVSGPIGHKNKYNNPRSFPQLNRGGMKERKC